MEDRSAKMAQAVQQMLNDLEKNYITPQRKKAFLCCADCCDRTSNAQTLQECVTRCEDFPQRIARMVDASLKEFQGRLQRCAVRCQDQAQDGLRPGAGESDIKNAQADFEKCTTGCLAEYEKKLPTLKKDLEQQLKQATK